MCIEGRVALASFTVFAILALYQVRILYGDYWSYVYCIATFGSASACVLVLPYNGIVKRSAFLGTVFGGSAVLLFVVGAPWNTFLLYTTALSFFHFSEYLMTAMYNSDRLSLDSFLLNHSFEYKVAAVASWIEFGIESFFFPSFKSFGVFSFIGLIMVIIGEISRKLAMITAKSNFSHIVQSHKKDGHVLVTGGIYSISRHPAYMGWFIWSVGMVNVPFLYLLVTHFLNFCIKLNFVLSYIQYSNYTRCPTKKFKFLMKYFSISKIYFSNIYFLIILRKD